MDVLDVLRCPGDVGEVAAGGVLAAFGSPRSAARVHEEKRSLCRHLHGLHTLATELLKDVVDDDVASLHELRGARVLARVALPDQNLLDPVALFDGLIVRGVGFFLVIKQLAGTVIGIHGNQQAALGIPDAIGAGLAAEAAEHLRVNHTEPRAGEHGDGQLRHHRHVQGHSVARLQSAEIAQQGCKLVDAHEKVLIGDVLDRLVLRLGHKMDRRLVLVLRKLAIHAVVARVDLATDEPTPERRMARIECRLPVLVPIKEVRELLEALGELLEGKAREDARVRQIGLRDELVRRQEVVFLRPMHRNLRLGDIGRRLLCHLALRLVFWHDQDLLDFPSPRFIQLGNSTSH